MTTESETVANTRRAQRRFLPEGATGALRVVLGYAGFAALWILLSDQAVGVLFDDPATIVHVSQLKGWLFVAVTSLLLYGLLMRLLLQLEQSRQREIDTELERRTAIDQVHSLSYYDSLTGLPNRRLLRDRLDQALHHSQHAGVLGAVLFVDLDDFNALNDTDGHDIGDRLLTLVGSRLLSIVQGGDTVARAGSDEFVVVVNAIGADEDAALLRARSIAERIQTTLAAPVPVGGRQLTCTAGIGICLFSGRESSVDGVLKQADAALFKAKHSGRGQIYFFDPGMQAALQERVQLERWLHDAIPSQLRLHYQMQVDAAGRICGAEALVRWQHPTRGMISPAEFIPLAEQTGSIRQIGRWVLDTACAQLKAWADRPATSALQLAVNVSAREFRHPDFVAAVRETLDRTGANPARLKLELTESILVEDIEGVIGTMRELRRTGLHFSLDDFGTGFSSLAYLRQLPLDQLKIDQSFVRNELADPNNAAIVSTIIALGQSLGLEVIAEGVETAGQRDFLAARGCRHFQGYFFGRPVPLDAFERLVESAAPSGAGPSAG